MATGVNSTIPQKKRAYSKSLGCWEYKNIWFSAFTFVFILLFQAIYVDI